jgi:hypothetical protein
LHRSKAINQSYPSSCLSIGLYVSYFHDQRERQLTFLQFSFNRFPFLLPQSSSIRFNYLLLASSSSESGSLPPHVVLLKLGGWMRMPALGRRDRLRSSLRIGLGRRVRSLSGPFMLAWTVGRSQLTISYGCPEGEFGVRRNIILDVVKSPWMIPVPCNRARMAPIDLIRSSILSASPTQNHPSAKFGRARTHL